MRFYEAQQLYRDAYEDRHVGKLFLETMEAINVRPGCKSLQISVHNIGDAFLLGSLTIPDGGTQEPLFTSIASIDNKAVELTLNPRIDFDALTDMFIDDGTVLR